jgi:hypothetical protein
MEKLTASMRLVEVHFLQVMWSCREGGALTEACTYKQCDGHLVEVEKKKHIPMISISCCKS